MLLEQHAQATTFRISTAGNDNNTCTRINQCYSRPARMVTFGPSYLRCTVCVVDCFHMEYVAAMKKRDRDSGLLVASDHSTQQGFVPVQKSLTSPTIIVAIVANPLLQSTVGQPRQTK